MGRAEREAPANLNLIEGRQAAELRVGDRLAFAYDTGAGMSPVRVGAGKPVPSSPGWVWGRVAGVSEALWHSYPMATDRRTMWVLCTFGDQSSIIRGIPCEVAIVTRRSAS